MDLVAVLLLSKKNEYCNNYENKMKYLTTDVLTLRNNQTLSEPWFCSLLSRSLLAAPLLVFTLTTLTCAIFHFYSDWIHWLHQLIDEEEGRNWDLPFLSNGLWPQQHHVIRVVHRPCLLNQNEVQMSSVFSHWVICTENWHSVDPCIVDHIKK